MACSYKGSMALSGNQTPHRAALERKNITANGSVINKARILSPSLR